MVYFLLLILSVGLIWSYKTYKDVFHPYVIFSFQWLLILFLYVFYPHDLYPLSTDFYVTLLIWVVSFSIFPIIHYKDTIKRENRREALFLKKERVQLLYKISITLVLSHLLVLVASGALSGNFYERFISEANNDKSFIEILFSYLQKVPIVFCGLAFWEKATLTKKQRYFLLALIFLSMSLMGGKTRLLQLLFMILFLTNEFNGIKLKKIAIFGVGIFMFFMLIQFFRIQDVDRKANFTVSEVFIHYVLAPLPSMDFVMHDKDEQVKGNTFRFFRQIGNKTGLSVTKESPFYGANDGWVFVPIPNNVFTVLHNVYCDYNNTGIFLYGLLSGFFWIKLYYKVRRREKIYILFYGLIIYALVMQFFDDLLLSYASDIIQYFFWAWLFLKLLIKDDRYIVSNL